MKSRTGEEQKAKEGTQQWGGWWEEKVKVEEEDDEANWPDITDLLSLLCSFTALTNAVETIFSALSCTLSDQNKSDLQIHQRRADQSPRLSPLKLLLWRTNYKPDITLKYSPDWRTLMFVWGNLLLTFCGFVLDGLLEDGDVLEGAEEQNHLVVLVPDGSHLHVEPHGTSCRDIASFVKQSPNDTKNVSTPAHPPPGNPTASRDVHLQKNCSLASRQCGP